MKIQKYSGGGLRWGVSVPREPQPIAASVQPAARPWQDGASIRRARGRLRGPQVPIDGIWPVSLPRSPGHGADQPALPARSRQPRPDLPRRASSAAGAAVQP